MAEWHPEPGSYAEYLEWLAWIQRGCVNQSAKLKQIYEEKVT